MINPHNNENVIREIYLTFYKSDGILKIHN